VSTTAAIAPATVADQAEPREFDALVLAIGQPAVQGKVCGLTLRERGRRLAIKAGAARVEIAESPDAAAAFSPTPGRDLLILRVSDQIVHFPLIEAVKDQPGDRPRIAISPDGEYGGAIWIPAGAGLCDGAPRGDAAAALATLGKPDGDVELAKQWRDTERATTHEYSGVARHRAVTREERKAATKYLFKLIWKPEQDGFLSYHLFRPVAYPITRFFLPTPVSPNGITFIVALLAIGGCVIVAGASYEAAVIGSVMQHVAGYFDCTDGEIARLRHEGSKFGMWFDTLTDEATTIAYMLCIGIHNYQRYPEYQQYIGPYIALGVIGSFVSLYVIYYYLIKVARSGNSQDYPVKGGEMQKKLAQFLHRDFIGLATMIMAIFNVTEIAAVGMALGGIVSAITLVPEHLKLRKDLASGKVVPKPA
jgi:phosphatidylglycerophosphate synthase